MRRRSVVWILLALATGGCTQSALTPSTIEEPTTTSAPSPTSTLPPVVDCPGAGEFGEGTGIANVEGEGSDASRLGRVSWEPSELCESFVFEFETSEGAPATSVPDITVEHLPSLQVIRISMNVTSTVITDQLVETDMVQRLYVVRSLGEGMFVDLHLNTPAAARARVQSSPGVLTVDLRPGFLEFNGVSTGQDVVVAVDPPSESEVDGVTTFSGYTRAFESNVTVIVTQGDAVITETSTTGADSTDTWGEFEIELALPPGPIEVFLGEASPEDGSLSGVILSLTVS